MPPPKPEIFHGREEHLAQLVGLVVSDQPARIALTGAGGMGKTTVALAILHDNSVCERFEARRFFISCEAAIDAQDAARFLARTLSLEPSKDPLSDVVQHLKDQPRTLIVVDNLETIWINDQTRSSTELFLRTLASVETVTLIITTRGIALPPGIRWSNKKTAGLDPLPLAAAQEVFIDVAGEPDSPAEADATTQLLRAVDCVPLAVWLLAQLAQRGNAPSHLMKRCTNSTTRVLRTEASGREHNIEASIELSLFFLPTRDVDAGPRDLLSACSLLPDGLLPAVREQLRKAFEDIDSAADLLQRHALVNIGPAGELKMLSPVRQFILRCHPVSDVHTTALRRIYFAIAMDAPTDPNKDFQERVAKFAPEYANVMAFLLYLSKDDSNITDRLVNAAAQAQYKVLGSRLDVADCLMRLGNLFHLQGNSEVALRKLGAAREEFSTFNDRLRLANTAWHLARVHWDLSQQSEALVQFEVTRDLYVQLGLQNNVENCDEQIIDIELLVW